MFLFCHHCLAKAETKVTSSLEEENEVAEHRA